MNKNIGYLKEIFFTIFVLMLILYSNPKNKLYEIEKKIIVNNINLNKDYLIDTSKYVNIYYDKKDEAYTLMIKMMVDTYYPLLLKDFKINQKPQLNIIIHSDKESLMEAINDNSKTVPMGVYYKGIIHILSPRCWTRNKNEIEIKDEFFKNGPVIHEMTHFVLDLKTNGNYEIWFTEGMALYYEYKYTGFEWEKNLKEAAEKISADELKNNFRNIDESLAYRKSFDIIKEIAEKNGESYLTKLCFELSKSKDTLDTIILE